MRARLSDATARVEHTRTRAQECYDVPEVTAGRDALAEARAILAENETPEPYGLVNGSPTAYGSLSSYWCKPARKSLADALAGLCDASDVAAYLAEMQSR